MVEQACTHKTVAKVQVRVLLESQLEGQRLAHNEML